jgi:serine/threonine-protein kinase
MDTKQPDGPAPDRRLGEILGAYLEAVDAGWAPPERELLSRYPELAHELVAFFDDQNRLVRLANPWRPAALPGPSANVPAPPQAGGLTVSQPSTLPPTDGTADGAGRHTGRSLDNYELLEELGRGGMGVVYKAWQIRPRRLVALKMILSGRFASAHEVRLIYDEAEAVAQLDHPHIVPLYEVGEHQGRPYFSMKLFEAGSLTRHLPRLAGDMRAAAQLLATVARAVHHAHQRGILHRDLKPGNILLDAQGQPHVADFGLARRLDRPAEPSLPPGGALIPDTADEASGPTKLPTTLHASGAAPGASAIAGTPGYMAPELAAGRKGALTTAADVYSLGAILYKILIGRPPLQPVTTEEALPHTQQLYPERPRALNPRVDRNLEAVCLKCLEKDPAGRYASAQALAEDLERWLRREPVLARRPPWPARLWRVVRRHALPVTAAALCGFAVAAVLLYSYFTDPERPLENLERRLARAEPVTLIGATGPPRWSSWTEGEDAVMVAPPDRDRAFSFAVFKFGRLKLLRSPQLTRYRFSAEVRHEAAGDQGKVGIYFAYKTAVLGQHLERFWCELTFADLGNLAGSVRGPKQKPDERPKYSTAALTIRRFADLGPALDSTRFTTVRKEYLDEGQNPTPWRRIGVEVTPEKIRAFWRDELIGELPLAMLLQLGRSMPLDPAGFSPQFEFAPDGALGLYVFRGQAAFRNVVVEPLK